jgi:hypothetical protein
MIFTFEYTDRIWFFTVFRSKATGHQCVGFVDDFGQIVTLF